MCGFVGFMGFSQSNQIGHNIVIKKMADAISHRGPDDDGYWLDNHHQIALGHRRLAIVDLTSAGHQPMMSENERFAMIFNGEIYNHEDLRKDLFSSGHISHWRGHSDTETLLAGFQVWGIQKTLERSIGMFAIAVWDREYNTLSLARDRIGEKPIYYGWQGEGESASFIFASELKALREHPAFEKRINRHALCLQLRHNYIPAPYSIYENISKLTPGTILTVSLSQRTPQISTYWNACEIISNGIANPFKGDSTEAVSQLDTLLKSAVKQQMMADVPLGAFLSGGIDSSTVVALMQEQSARPVKTFTIGFNEQGFNEAEYAKVVANHLGTDHTELYVTSQQAMDVIPKLPEIYDEPFSDSSQIPTFLVSQLAREHVTVSLSGDAGDELFCGYNRYQMTSSVWSKLEIVPAAFKHLISNGITSISPNAWDNFGNKLKLLLPSQLGYWDLGDKLHKGASVLSSRTCDELYLGLVSHWTNPSQLVISGMEPPTLLSSKQSNLDGLDHIQKMMALDTLTYLPDDILVKVDRAAMAVSLESRVPFLDHRVIEFAWSLPQSMKLHEGQSKWVLRQVLNRYVPKSMIDRPKMGFGVPIGEWLRGPLREWAESLLDESRLRKEGFFHPELIQRKWSEHLSGKRNWQYHLWDVLMFQAWLETQ